MNRLSLTVKTARMLQKLPQGWLRALEAPLVRRVANKPNIIFLLALPRSGSTLTYQALVHSVRPLYLSNLSNLMYGIPWFGGRLSHRLCSDYESDFCSDHGFVGGLYGPAEGLRFWSYWTAAGLDESFPPSMDQALRDKRIKYLRQVMCALTSPDKPFVSGYLGHVLITEYLRHWFPEAVFLRLNRDPLSNAKSILQSRITGSKSWLSTRPKECLANMNAGIHAEVAAQVYWLNRRLNWLKDDDRTIHVSYESLAADPNAVLQQVISACNTRGFSITAQKTLPGAFYYQKASPEDDLDTVLITSELEKLKAEYGPL